MGLKAQNKAAELKLRAERKAGELLAALSLRGGDRKSNGHDVRLILTDLGVSQAQPKRWQKEAAVPEPEFVQYVERAGQLGEEVTAAGLLRLSRKGSSTAVPIKANTPQQEHQEILLSMPTVRLQEIPVPHNGRSDQEATDRERAEQLELVQEVSNHLALLRSLLAPVCDGAIENLLPIQRQAIQRYLAEASRLLALLGAQEQRSSKMRCRICRRLKPAWHDLPPSRRLEQRDVRFVRDSFVASRHQNLRRIFVARALGIIEKAIWHARLSPLETFIFPCVFALPSAGTLYADQMLAISPAVRPPH